MNVGSKERELHRLLEVLRIKAEIHVLVNLTFHPRVFFLPPIHHGFPEGVGPYFFFAYIRFRI